MFTRKIDLQHSTIFSNMHFHTVCHSIDQQHRKLVENIIYSEKKKVTFEVNLICLQ